MHGAVRATPVTIVENASRPDQRILATTLDRLPEDLAAAEMAGPALTFLGLAPRAAATVLQETPIQEMA
jgi:siroheme synthase